MTTATNWINGAIFYHIYPIGFCGAPLLNTGVNPTSRIEKILEWIPHLRDLHVNALYLGPVFESTVHGYDTTNYMKIDPRLGDNESFKKVCDILHANDIRVVLDGVFNHVGRDFPQFKDLRENLQQSQYKDWFCNVNFNQTSPSGDHFSYEGWEGHTNLVKLNLRNPEVADHLINAVEMWMDEFGIDGLRLDAANCVDKDFFKRLRSFTKGKNPDFWLMGEIIHGDYRQWANPDMLDSVTNYECYKGLYSSHNEKNYFEIAYSLNRQFGTEALYRDINLYTFVDNHDVNRLASTITNPKLLKNVYTMMYAMPGIPSIYYGSEWGILGKRDNSSDGMLRPCLDLENIPDANLELLEHIKALGKLREMLPALQYGVYEQIIVKNEQLVFKRSCLTQTVYAVFNLADREASLPFKIKGTSLSNMLSESDKIIATNNSVDVIIPAYSSMLLVEENVVEKKPLIEKQGVVIGGKYHHFKGGDYVVVQVGRHSETLEDMVVYKEINDQQNVWIRPLKMFTEEVNDFGNIKQRFKFCE